EVWNVSAPEIAWAVNISGDGRLALAAYADGTIRWYRMADGKELLAFFPHKDRKRWALLTPLSYYDASPGPRTGSAGTSGTGTTRRLTSFLLGSSARFITDLILS